MHHLTAVAQVDYVEAGREVVSAVFWFGLGALLRPFSVMW